MPPIEEQTILGDATLGGAPEGASSTEDFWMFFTFAMILLVFVLMNYVNYLYSMVVELEKDVPQQEELQERDELTEPDLQGEIRIYVKKRDHTVLYAFSDDEDNLIELSALESELRHRVERLSDSPRRPNKLTVFVHAPGDVFYQDVFNASYAAWELGQPAGSVPFDLDVSLVYQEADE